MKTRHYIVLATCFTNLISDASAPLQTSLAAEEPTTLVSVEDIGPKVKLIGRLGEPLGTTMEVKGTWRMPDIRVKDYSPRFTVSHVNGRALKKPVEFNVAQIEAVSRLDTNAIPEREKRKTLDGVAWTMRAYETGRFNGRPQDFWKEHGSGPEASPYWYSTFTSELVGVVQER